MKGTSELMQLIFGRFYSFLEITMPGEFLHADVPDEIYINALIFRTCKHSLNQPIYLLAFYFIHIALLLIVQQVGS